MIAQDFGPERVLATESMADLRSAASPPGGRTLPPPPGRRYHQRPTRANEPHLRALSRHLAVVKDHKGVYPETPREL